MCTSKPPAPPAPDPSIKQQQEAQKAEVTAEKREQRDKALAQAVTRLRGGSGRRSLIKGSGGGMGFYSRYL
tara:strand:- start:14887 stop:15099 length:213 start_codon:yes stop_codon:yes gene_type:complete